MPSPSSSPRNRGSPRLGGSSVLPGAGSSSSASASTSKESSKASRLSRVASRAAQHIGSVPDDWPMYSSQPEDYILGDIIGLGASSVVYQAAFQPLNGRACAVKVIDLEAYGRDTEELRRETQLMSLSKHPNVLRVRGCWVSGSKLHIATRLMSAGSMLDLMRFSFPEGFDEAVIATVLKQALEGLNYLHINGWLHRDLKAANILIDDDGTVLLGDFGVGVFLGDAGPDSEDGSSKGKGKGGSEPWAEGKRKSFVGTPCWMAPEVVERKHYGTPADIWSFGITALELSSGRAPRSRLPPVKVLMKTLEESPPTLDRTGGAHQYSKVFDDFVRQCLQKDPAKRPTAEKLLGHAFFKQAKPKKFLVTAILAGLPPLAERQERRRAMSIASLRNQASWDFGSVSSRAGTLSLANGSGAVPGSAGPMTPSGEKYDPFRNFTGTVYAGPISPAGSMRSRIVSLDGEHAFVEDESTDLKKLNERWRGSLNRSEGGTTADELNGRAEWRLSARGRSALLDGANSNHARQRNLSTDSGPGATGSLRGGGAGGGTRHRKSVSFTDAEHGAAAVAAATPATTNGDAKEAEGQEAPSQPATQPHEVEATSATGTGLEPIAEARSPVLGRVNSNGRSSLDAPPLTLPEASLGGSEAKDETKQPQAAQAPAPAPGTTSHNRRPSLANLLNVAPIKMGRSTSADSTNSGAATASSASAEKGESQVKVPARLGKLFGRGKG